MTPPRSTLEAMADALDKATCPENVFGALVGSPAQQTAALKVQVRALTKVCHPDAALPKDKTVATGVFQSLSEWEALARRKIEQGTYGDKKPVVAEPPYVPVELVVRGKSLTLSGLIAQGTFADVHTARYEGEVGGAPFVKYARDARDNDLLEREFAALKTFHEPDARPEAEAFLVAQRAYVPRPITSFLVRDEAGVKHHANLLSVPSGRAWTAHALRREVFPGGIEPKHVWWIFRRLLLTLWMAHLKGFVHGGVTPDHLLIFPDEHGVVLLDWTCAATLGEEHVRAVNPAFEAFYPPELLRKEVALPSADLWMAAATAIWMLGGDAATRQIPDTVPPALAQALLRCLAPLARRRPQDAEAFHNEFGDLLGHRVYAHMVIP